MKKNLQKHNFKKKSFTTLLQSLACIKYLKLIIVCLIAFLTQNAFSQSIFTNPITDANPSASNPFTTGQTVDANLTVSGIGYGSGLTAVSSIDRYNFKSWPTGGLSTTDYIEFVLTPNSTFKINLSSLVYTGAISSGGPSSLVLRSSVDAFGSDISSLSATGQTVSLSAVAFQNRTTAITFRIYGYGATAATGTFSINSFTFNGTVIPTTPTIPVITSALTASNIINIPATPYQITASNFPASFSATNLPPGLSINTSTGQITGTPTSAAGSPNVIISATNAAGTGSATLVYTVNLQTCTTTGQVVWNFDTPSASPSSFTTTNLVISDVIRGNNNNGTSSSFPTTSPILFDNSSPSNTYSGFSAGTNIGAATRDGALNLAANGSAYFEFTLTPAVNFTSTLNAIQFGLRSTGTGPKSYSIRSSLDNYASNIANATTLANSTWDLKTPTLTATQSALGTSVTYRIYGFDGSGASANIATWRIDDVKLTVNIIRSPPTIFAITNNGTSYCSGGVGIAVGLAGSQSGVNYQLILNGTTNIGAVVVGSGSAISFGNQTAAGTYSVNATYNNTTCLSVMSNPFSISVNNANTWTGALSTAWENTGNWACGIVPNVNTIQIDIPNAPPSGRQPVLNSNVIISGILNLIGTNSTLTLNGNILTLNSTITGSGSLIGSATSNLIIDNDAGTAFSINMHQIGNNNQLNNYTQNRNATITLTNPLLINGVVNNASTSGTLASGSGNLTLLSTASITSGIAYLNIGANVSGNVNVQSYFTGGNINNRGTRMIAFPVIDPASPNNIFQQIKSQMFFTGPGNTSNNFDLGGTGVPNATTMVTQNESKLDSEYGFNLIPTLQTPTIPATAYFLFYRGNRTSNITNKLNPPFAIPENVTQNYNGTINKGTINIGVTFTANSGNLYNGICAIGNPYPAVIDFDAFLSDNSNRLEDILSIIKPDRTGQITKIGTVSTNNNFNAPIGTTAQDIRYIQPCQSFYVRVKPGQNGNVTFNETQKATQITSPARLLGKPERNIILSSQKQTNNNTKTQKVLRIAITDNILNNETAVIFKEGSLATYQNNDAILLTNPILNCATLSSDSVAMAINLMPKITNSTTIKLLVNSETTNQNLKLNFSNLTDFTNYTLVLKDSYLNTLTPITPNNATYNFGIDKNIKPSFGNKRLELLIEPKIVLPLNFISFAVEPESANAKLKWQVNDQTDVTHFEILKATDGINFTTIGQRLKTKERNDFYTYVDEHLDENNYYQIKQINTDGSFETSQIKYLGTQINHLDFKIFPNPVNKEFTLQCPNTKAKNLEITLYDLTGKKIKIFISEPKNQLKFNIADLPSGVYILQVKHQNLNQVLFKSKFIKQ